jgi:hypothetical protein
MIHTRLPEGHERAMQTLVFMPFKLGGRVSNKLGVPE